MKTVTLIVKCSVGVGVWVFCRPWDTEVCGNSICSSCEAQIKYKSSGRPLLWKMARTEGGREGGCVGGWTRTHPPRRTNINNYRLEIRAGLCSSGVLSAGPDAGNRVPNNLS